MAGSNTARTESGAAGARMALSGRGRVWLLGAAISACAVAFYALWLRDLPPADDSRPIPWWVLAIVFGLAERFVIHLEFRRDAHSFSLSEVPLVVGLFYVAPPQLFLAVLTGSGIALLLDRRQVPLKLFFNLSALCLNTAVAISVFRLLVPYLDPISREDWSKLPAAWVAALVATAVSALLSHLLINLAIYLSEGALPPRAWSRLLVIAELVTLTNTSLGLWAVVVLSRDLTTAPLALVPAAVLILLARAYVGERQRHVSVEFLYESTRLINSSLRVEPTMLTLLSQIRKMFNAESAEILDFSSENHTGYRTTLGPGEASEVMEPVALDPKEGVWARIAAEQQGILLSKPIQNEHLRRHFAARHVKDAMIAPLYRDGGVIGVISACNRLGDVSTFGPDDMRLFETLVNHASVSLENAHLVGRLEESLDRVSKANRAKDNLVAAVSHELRTPLACIQGYVKTLLRHGVRFDPERQRSFLQEVDGAGDHLRRLIERLLEVSELDDSTVERPKITLSTFSLPVLIRQVIDELAAGGQDRVVEIQSDPRAGVVQSDEGKVRQILSNLVENAIKYSPADTALTITTRRADEGVVVSVEDRGSGIPPEAQEKIFERFYQVDQSSTRSIGGTGLGLYLCKRLSEAIGGHLWLERSDATGSVFSLQIPSGRTEILEEKLFRGVSLDRLESLTRRSN